MNTISSLALGQSAVISRLKLSGRQRQHMEDLGFVPGAPVCPLHRGPSGDPTAYSVMGAVIALRREDASQILCVPCEENQTPPHGCPCEGRALS